MRHEIYHVAPDSSLGLREKFVVATSKERAVGVYNKNCTLEQKEQVIRAYQEGLVSVDCYGEETGQLKTI